MILLPRLCSGYRGIFPAVPVDSAPMHTSTSTTTTGYTQCLAVDTQKYSDSPRRLLKRGAKPDALNDAQSTAPKHSLKA